MAIDIFGFIEVARFDDDLERENAWTFCVDILPFPLLADDMCAIMFGISRWKIEWNSIAHDRGVPPALSYAGRKMLAEATAYQGADKPYGYTYITYEEIKQINWLAYAGADLEEIEKPFGWYALFRTMDALSECFLAQRLVVWFQW